MQIVHLTHETIIALKQINFELAESNNGNLSKEIFYQKITQNIQNLKTNISIIQNSSNNTKADQNILTKINDQINSFEHSISLSKQDEKKNIHSNYADWIQLSNETSKALQELHLGIEQKLDVIENKNKGDEVRIIIFEFIIFSFGALFLFLLAFKFNKMNKKYIEQLSRNMESARLATLGEMAGGIAHEINNPLSIIQLLTEQMKDSVKENHFDKARFEQVITKIDKTIERITKIIKGLRFYARSGENDPHQLIPVNKIIEDTISLCQEKFKIRGISLEQPNKEKLNPSIYCSPTQISQVLLNLLNNSHDAVLPLSQKWIRIEVKENNNTISIVVSDSGNGIDEEIRMKIMEPFFTTKEVGKGTGLGLSISKGIMENHGGKLLLDEESAHTAFILEFPLPKSNKIAA